MQQKFAIKNQVYLWRYLTIFFFFWQKTENCQPYRKLQLSVFRPLVEVDVEDEGFDLIQPTLIQQLRKILDEYPDDGQILKVGNLM